ncbi:MAG TPA: hypothetical protein VMR25_13790, partial [Planctomycetaceae bacterium]|nr:hypothetical protein [Planctomycetaceae bacterium]
QALLSEFHRIQPAVGIKLFCREARDDTPACRFDRFHDVRFEFATSNAANRAAEVLQKRMRQQSPDTATVR